MSKSLQDIIEEISASLESKFDNNINTNTTSFMGFVTDILAASDYDIYQLIDAVRASINLSTANDKQLMVLAKLMLATKKQPTSAVFEGLTITGTANSSLTGLQISISGSSNLTYTLSGTVTLDGSGAGSGDFVADTTGVQQIATDITTITFTVENDLDNVSSVGTDSSSAYVAGTDLESTPAFRSRLRYSNSKNGTNLVDSLGGSLLQSRFVDKALVYEYKMSYNFNPTTQQERSPVEAPAWQGSTAPTTEKGVLGYVEAVVKKTTVPTSEQDEQKNAIAQIMYNHQVPATIYDKGYDTDPNVGGGQEMGVAKNSDGDTVNVFYTLANEMPVSAEIVIEKKTQGAPDDNTVIENNLKKALREYLDTIVIAGEAYFMDAYVDLAVTLVGATIKSFKWSAGSATNVTTDLDLRSLDGARSYFDADLPNITVTIQ